MAKKISELDAAATLAGTETLPVVQSSATKKATVQQVLDRFVATRTTVELSAEHSKTNDETPALDSELFLNLPAGVWLVRGLINAAYTYGDGGLYARIGPGTATVAAIYSSTVHSSDAAGILSSIPANNSLTGNGVLSVDDGEAAGFSSYLVDMVVVVTAAGTVGLVWSQGEDQASANPTSITTPSWLAAVRLGAAS